MTTFQDPQPQSRRAVRQSERADAPETGIETTGGFAPQQGVPAVYAEQNPMWDTTARRAAQLPLSAPPRQEPPAAGRRAAPAPVAEPLTYSTQTRAQVPTYDGPSFRTRSTEATDAPAATPPQVTTRADQGSFRVRDFSPEGRRAAREAERASAPAPAAPPSDLDYQTQGRVTPIRPDVVIPVPVSQVPPAVAAPPAPAPAPAAAPVYNYDPTDDFPIEQTLTRRELRAMQQAEEAARAAQQPAAQQPAAQAPAAQAPVAQAPATVPVAPQPVAERPPVAQQAYPILTSQQPPAQAPAADEAVPVAEAQTPAAARPEAPAAPQPELSPFDALFRAPQEPEALVEPPRSAPQPQAGPELTSALAEFDALSLFSQQPPAAPAAPVAAPAAPVATTEPAPAPSLITEVPAAVAPQRVEQSESTWTPPVGHWSTQLDEDDDELPENTINRRIGSGHTATNALVLPSIPNDIRGPLTSTGEVMLTGSIDLPMNLAATGQSDRYDHGGIDDLFDANDSEIISTDSSPVRAIRAVSTHTSGHGVTHTQKPKGTRALTALLIAASSMAVVVAGLLVAAFAFNVF